MRALRAVYGQHCDSVTVCQAVQQGGKSQHNQSCRWALRRCTNTNCIHRKHVHATVPRDVNMQQVNLEPPQSV
jgi:hypothetical protein